MANVSKKQKSISADDIASSSCDPIARLVYISIKVVTHRVPTLRLKQHTGNLDSETCNGRVDSEMWTHHCVRLPAI